MTMSPDDPRHGSNAGAVQHWKNGELACSPCLAASGRVRKRNRYRRTQGITGRVPMGTAAYDIITTVPRAQVAKQAGMTHERIRRYELAGPEQMVARDTQARILAVRAEWTPIGIQRRVQALTAIGYSGPALALMTGCHHDSIKKLRGRQRPDFVRQDMAEAILAVYKRLHMTPAPESASRGACIALARRREYAPPLAWDDIDNIADKPHGLVRGAYRGRSDLDEAVVERVIAGEQLHTTRAEKQEVRRRWVEAGRSINELEKMTGWNAARYKAEVA